jgi:glycosyltransferase involved in cell wall biosynthesis
MNGNGQQSRSGIRVLQAVTNTWGLSFLRGQRRFKEGGFDVAVLTSPGLEVDEYSNREKAPVYTVEMRSDISLWFDCWALWRVWRCIRRIRPILTDVGTPKAGLLCGLAALVAGVPCRIYTLRGLRYETTQGWKRRLLIAVEKLACGSAHLVVCVSHSVRNEAIKLGIVEAEKAVVLCSGSSNGVDVDHFGASEINRKRALEIRKQYKISERTLVVGYVGRLTPDKGIPDLLHAFKQLQMRLPNIKLLLVGAMGALDSGDPLPETCHRGIQSDPDIIVTGICRDPAPYYHVMNVLALPTYREGFPNTVLEAYSAGVPVVTTDATGAIDSVKDSVTGFCIPVGDREKLADVIETLLRQPLLATQMGIAGREMVLANFRTEMVADARMNEYRALITKKGFSPALELGSQRTVRTEADTVTIYGTP